MSQSIEQHFLSRLLRVREEGAGEPPPSAARMLRQSMARAAEQALSLRLGVLGVAEETLTLDPALAGLNADMMLIGLIGPEGALVGLAGLDSEARAAIVEVQTLGALHARKAATRPITATDAALSLPLIDALLRDLTERSEGTPLFGWTNGCRAVKRFAGAEAAALALPDIDYRLARLTLDLGGEGRQGALMLLLPARPEEAGQPRPAAQPDFGADLRASVLSAPADLNAVLHRITLPLAAIEAFEVGQMVALPGVTVASVALEGPGGAVWAKARLGQTNGLKAVRLEVPAAPEMVERAPARRAIG